MTEGMMTEGTMTEMLDLVRIDSGFAKVSAGQNSRSWSGLELKQARALSPIRSGLQFRLG